MRPPPARAELDDFVAAFEEARGRGADAPIAAFLPPPGHPAFLATLTELVRVDLEYSWRDGGRRPLGEYVEAFPALAADPGSLRDVAFEEYRLRVLAGEQPLPAEYAARFGIDTSGWFVPPPARVTPTRRIDPAPSPARAEEADFSVGEGVVVRDTFPEPGQNVAGFVLVRELGRGSFGRVFLAEQQQLVARPIALKLIPASFVGEAEALARLQHANIVPIYSLHRVGGLAAICMPYLGGLTVGELVRRLRREPTLPAGGRWIVEQLGEPAVSAGQGVAREWLARAGYVEAVLWLGARLAEGLAHAHDRGVVHRDVKPANLLLADDGTPMLLDFNLAVEADPERQGTYALAGGTLPYMAPEYLQGLRHGRARSEPRGDLFALGLVLYELLTGKFPFPDRHGSLAEVLDAAAQDREHRPADPSRVNLAVTPAVGSILRKCLEPDPARRYQSAHELREDLQRQLEDRPLRHASEPSVRERWRKWSRRHPRLASSGTMLAVALVPLLALLGAFLYQARQREILVAVRDAESLRRVAREAALLLAAPDGDPAQAREGVRQCERIAASYGVLADESWRHHSSFRYLGEDERRQAERALTEALWLWARAESWAGRHAEAWRIHQAARRCCPEGEAPGVLRRQAARLAKLAGAEDEPLPEGAPFPPARERFLDLLELADQGRWRQALPLLQAATADEAENPTVWLLLARVHIELGDAATAALFSGLAAARAPEWPWGWFHHGAYALAAKQWRAAEEASARAAALRPDLVAARMNRAVALLSLGEPRGAVAELDLALEFDAAPTRVLFQRSVAKRQAGDQAGARRDYEEGLRREPADELSFVVRGVARLPADPAGALADFDAALRLNPCSLRALQNRAHVLSEYLKRTDDAVAALDRLLALRDGDLEALSGRAVLLGRLGRCEAAVRDARAVLAAEPPAKFLYPIACAFALSGTHRAEAMKHLGKALRLEPSWLQVASRDPDLASLKGDPEFERLTRPAK